MFLHCGTGDPDAVDDAVYGIDTTIVSIQVIRREILDCGPKLTLGIGFSDGQTSFFRAGLVGS
jgi:hypothetical protein